MQKTVDYQSCCPLCGQDTPAFYCRDHLRHYEHCSACDLVFVPPQYHLSDEQEKAEYDLHQNELHDPHYRRFLSRLAEPLTDRLTADSEGLDFGCGPGPALAAMLRNAGFRVELFDKFYFNNPVALENYYDFITATEVVEHLRQPGPTLETLWRQLKPTGVLAVMTKRVIDKEAFSNWHYKNDPTHIAFFSERTFEWLARQWQAECVFVEKDVVLIQKI